MRTYAIIPTLNEGASIAKLVAELCDGVCDGVVVVDGGSDDDTVRQARASGACVVVEPRRGYGRAVTTGMNAARVLGAQACVVVDGNGSIGKEEVARVLAPVREGQADLSIGVRENRQKLHWHQRMGNRLATETIARFCGYRFFDVGSVRAMRCDALESLALDEWGHGWPLQLQVRAAAAGLRIAQVPVRLHARQSASKVSGTWRGSLSASLAFSRILFLECVLGKS